AIRCADGRTVGMSEGCARQDSEVLSRLESASDAQKYKGGGVDVDKLPALFVKWSKAAWGDMLNRLPEEDDAEVAADSPSGEEFVRLVREAMLSQVVLGETITGHGGQTQVERRSLLGWCQRFARPGDWEQIRSYCCWCKLEELPGREVRLKVA